MRNYQFRLRDLFFYIFFAALLSSLVAEFVRVWEIRHRKLDLVPALPLPHWTESRIIDHAGPIFGLVIQGGFWCG